MIFFVKTCQSQKKFLLKGLYRKRQLFDTFSNKSSWLLSPDIEESGLISVSFTQRARKELQV